MQPQNLQRLTCLTMLIVALMWLCCPRVLAAENIDAAQLMQRGVIQTATDIFMQEANAVSTKIEQAATRLFWILCSIAIVLNGIRLILRDGDLQAFIAVLVRFVFIIGVFEFLLRNGGAIGATVVNSLTDLTAKNGSGPVELADAVIEVSFALLESIEESSGWFSVNKLIMGLFLILFDFILFSVVASCVVLFLSAYVLCVLGVFVLGFGALQYTRPIAVNYLKSILGVSLELMTMILICNAGVRGIDLVRQMLEGGGKITFSVYVMLLLVAMLIWACSRTLPALVGSLVYSYDTSSRTLNLANGFAAQLRLPTAPFKTVFKNTGARQR